MRDHFCTRTLPLRLPRVNDICYVDTFFSSVLSAQGYRCFNLFSYKKSGLDVVDLRRQRGSAYNGMEDVFKENGVPIAVHSDNANEFKSKLWERTLRKLGTSKPQRFSEAGHQNQNIAEYRGGALKAAVTHVLHVTGAPLSFWCYALEYVALVRSHLARRSLDWRSPREKHFGDTPDISIFRFPFWQPVWYYAPKQQFPQSKMLPGRFLGIAQNTGDAFCYLVLTHPTKESGNRYPVIGRSVVRKRYPREEPPVVSESERGVLQFFKSDGQTPLPDPPAVLAESTHVTNRHAGIQTIRQTDQCQNLSIAI